MNNIFFGNIAHYFKSLFSNSELVMGSTLVGMVAAFLFPEEAYIPATLSTVIMFGVDLLTRLMAIAKTHGGFIKSFKDHHIQSRRIFWGTAEKFVVLMILLTIGGCGYKISPIILPAKILMYGFFVLMFSRDLTSIFENLIEAGYKDIIPFQKFAKKKIDDVMDSLSPSQNEGDLTQDIPAESPKNKEEESI